MAGVLTRMRDMTVDTFGQRMFRAFTLLRLRRGGDLSQTWLAEELARVMGKPEPFSQGAISRYMHGQIPGELDTILGLAKVLGVDPGWLAFGDESEAPAPDDPLRDRFGPPLEQP